MNTRLQETQIPGSGESSLKTIENLASLAEDLNSAAVARASDNLDDLIAQRFGPNVSRQQVEEAMNAMRDLSIPEPETNTPS